MGDTWEIAHLREEEDTVAFPPQLWQELIEEHHLSRRAHKALNVQLRVGLAHHLELLVPVERVGQLALGAWRAHARLRLEDRDRSLLDVVDEPGVVAAVAEHHRDVSKRSSHVRGGALGGATLLALPTEDIH